ncbi:MAG: 50S ribosomal protein L18 [Candidatus Thermoplasmatota archaeon]|jgi:large subunit ribosomal protein L18|nr:50S ribosomal protein L18 [Candidatus Thermoplasmatota archaeon]MCL5786222.1 50S ribosomal protein L18 [Candidatus Thermoplasmatota archaeon]
MKTSRTFKRRKSGQTDYRRRLAIVKSSKPRLVVRPSGKGISVQIVKYAPRGDIVMKTVTDRSLKDRGFDIAGNSTPVAYLVGKVMAEEAKKAGISEVILDSGRRNIVRGGRISATVMGYVEAGGNMSHDPSIFPSEERIAGTHLKDKAVGKQIEKVRGPVEQKKAAQPKKPSDQKKAESSKQAKGEKKPAAGKKTAPEGSKSVKKSGGEKDARK